MVNGDMSAVILDENGEELVRVERPWTDRASEECLEGNELCIHNGSHACTHFEYLGSRNRTALGTTCQHWTDTEPHNHCRMQMVDVGSENFCRSAGEEPGEGPWCFTTNSSVRWERCFPPCALPDFAPFIDVSEDSLSPFIDNHFGARRPASHFSLLYDVLLGTQYLSSPFLGSVSQPSPGIQEAGTIEQG